MIEKLGPNVAASIVGDAYDPDYVYELETSTDGFQLIVTHRKTGESRVTPLVPDEVRTEVIRPARREFGRRKITRFDVLSALTDVVLIAGIVLSILSVFLRPVI